MAPRSDAPSRRPTVRSTPTRTGAAPAGVRSALAADASTRDGRRENMCLVPDREHAQVVRRSFARQVALFSGPDSPFVQRDPSALSWIEPLHDDMVVLDVACGAAHA